MLATFKSEAIERHIETSGYFFDRWPHCQGIAAETFLSVSIGVHRWQILFFKRFKRLQIEARTVKSPPMDTDGHRCAVESICKSKHRFRTIQAAEKAYPSHR
ncbi:MAG: hypothetical protein Q8O00_11880 [Holophaga sp.]|nr:hypothetical protein [Holophaga sp.]